jgi:thymidine phosphorylase
MREVTLELAREMLRLVGLEADPEAALDDGSALDRWNRMVRAQGGDPDAPLATAPHQEPVVAPRDGWLEDLDALAVGLASTRLGAGRLRPGEAVSAAAGIECLVKPGEPVRAGQPVLMLHADDPGRIPAARAALDGAWSVSSEQPEVPSVVMERIAADD